MSGHSKWETTKRQKAVNDAKRGAVFTKLGNQIAIAARGGTDPTMNSSLELAIEKAKAANMPNANIQRAIDRVNDKNAAALEEATYEGMGPKGIGIIIEVATDNKNRTLPEVKNALAKNGGRIADTGSVLFQFDRKGVILVAASGEEVLLKVLDAGAEDATETDGQMTVYTDQKELAKVRSALKKAGLEVKSAELQYVPKNYIEVDEPEAAQKLEKILDALDELDDVSNINTNARVTAALDEN